LIEVDGRGVGEFGMSKPARLLVSITILGEDVKALSVLTKIKRTYHHY
jgi:hypothetical protein